jgi:hypothetical protein
LPDPELLAVRVAFRLVVVAYRSRRWAVIYNYARLGRTRLRSVARSVTAIVSTINSFRLSVI